MKFAIIGKGFIFERHKKAIEDLGHEVSMTCDIDPEKGADYTDWLEMYHQPEFDEIDAVIICTPNYLHSAMAREALIRNKKVLSEKPLCTDTWYGLEDVNTVLQLRHHPKLKGLRPSKVHVEAKMFRDDKYWNGWKGDVNKSGGILYNLGVHYIDLLIFLMGDTLKINHSKVTDKLAVGEVMFEGGVGTFHIEIVDSKEKQGRNILVDGVEVNLSNQENLSYEDLHKYVYADFINGKGIELEEAKKSLRLIDSLIWTSKLATSV